MSMCLCVCVPRKGHHVCAHVCVCVCAFSRSGERTRPRGAQRDARHDESRHDESGLAAVLGWAPQIFMRAGMLARVREEGKGVAPGLHLCAELLQRIRLALVQGCR